MGPVCAFKTYSGLPSLLYQNVTRPSSSPDMISRPWSRQTTILYLGLPCVFPMRRVFFSLPGTPMSNIVIYPLISDASKKFWHGTILDVSLYFDDEKPPMLILLVKPRIHTFWSVSIVVINSGCVGNAFKMKTFPQPLATKIMLRNKSCIIAFSPD